LIPYKLRTAKNAQTGALPFLHCAPQNIQGSWRSENSILMRQAIEKADIRVYADLRFGGLLRRLYAIFMRFFSHFCLEKRMDIA
jgi:hypothetical protein